MSTEGSRKVTDDHLQRDAFLYVRQSTIRQVFENTESSKRQYALRDRAVALGWPPERIRVIDCDQGHSGASVADREGFQQLTREVGMGRAGIVLGLEVSRLARNCSDWHRLLEICALTGTLILDEEGIYDPGDFNDRLLLGLKGTMSEAELHMIRARCRGGILNKARRGEFRTRLPIGYVYGEDGTVELDPDQQVQATVRLFFETFRRTGSVLGVVRHFRTQELLFPRRLQTGAGKGDLHWAKLCNASALHLLHNPRYTGAYCYGRSRRRRGGNSRQRQRLPREEWIVFLPGAYPGYITWKEYEENQEWIAANAQRFGKERQKGPPREGSGLLQGLVICGRCGRRMGVRYHLRRSGERVPCYFCQYEATSHGAKTCQAVWGIGVDAAISDLLLELVSPITLEVALSVERELRARSEEADSLRQKEVERARYEAELARRRYMKVDPDNRLVADELEAGWNAKLRFFHKAQEEYERHRAEEAMDLDSEASRKILALATDFPGLWKHPATPQSERKRMVRLLIEDVVLRKEQEKVSAHVRLKGGAMRTLEIARPVKLADQRRTPRSTVEEVDRLLGEHTVREIAGILRERGLRAGAGGELTVAAVRRIVSAYKLKTRYQRLRARGLLTLKEAAEILGIERTSVYRMRLSGKIKGHWYNDRGQFLYERPQAPRRQRCKREAGRKTQACTHMPDEV
jgi:DNA invertase Pin-like site-specific DNA recombinase